MHISRIMVRWYRSFNTLSIDRVERDPFREASWNNLEGESFPFVHLHLHDQITTIVGANEAGKSHLLSAIAKAFNGESPTQNGSPSKYDRQDICRYCGFDHLATDYWPQFVVELSSENDDDLASLTSIADSGKAEVKKLWVLIDGSDAKSFAKVYLSPTTASSRSLTQEQWQKIASEQLPEVRFITANRALANEVHVKQLINMFDKALPGAAYDPVALQDLADSFVDMEVSANKPVDADTVTAYRGLRSKLKTMQIGPKEQGQLEILLFRDVLQIEKKSLQEILELASTNQPHVQRIVADIQARVDERLDLSRVWQQDSELRLIVTFEAGFFFFRITDRTGIRYTFEERSSGLRFFLSYYIQALALEQVGEDRGMLVLMDEPDGFLSAAGQRNLLNVFENLVDRRRTSTRNQVVYTTHSPFLINRNFPGRVRLVRKGDGAEGTQVVDHAAFRRFEPVRTALGIDYADTLFVGSQNIILEGPSDQRLIMSAIQFLGRQKVADSLLDLNRVVLVAAGGANRMRRVIERSIGGTDDKIPVAVAVLDGDLAGSKACQEITENGVLKKEYVLMLDSIGFINPDVDSPSVLEDLLPVGMLARATHDCLKQRWGIEMSVADCRAVLATKVSGDMAKRMKVIFSQHQQLAEVGIEQDDFRAAVVEQLCDHLLMPLHDVAASVESLVATVDVEVLEKNLRQLCESLAVALDRASADSSRNVAKKRVLFIVQEFRRSRRIRASKADVRRCLASLLAEVSGQSIELRKARDNLEKLQAELDLETVEADAEVDRAKWVKRLEGFAAQPWGN
jgi:AAA domain, putative AbiEii toxin, Type IV TA system